MKIKLLIFICILISFCLTSCIAMSYNGQAGDTTETFLETDNSEITTETFLETDDSEITTETFIETDNSEITTENSSNLLEESEMEIPDKAVKAYVGFESLNRGDYNLANCADVHYNSGLASKRYCDLYEFSDDISILPVYGTYLESMDMVVILFYKDGFFVGTSTLEFNFAEEQATTEEFDTFNYTTVPDALSDLVCYYATLSCINRNPKFEIMGVVYNFKGDSLIIIGKNEDERHIKYIAGEPQFFGLVEPFETIEQGRQAFEEYFTIREEIVSSLQVFPWKTSELSERGYMNKYEVIDVFVSKDCEIELGVLSEYESLSVIPLLDLNCQENVYVLHLLYYHNRLIGEFVLENTTDVYGNPLYQCVWKNIADKNEDGTYKDLGESRYQKTIDLAKSFIYLSDNQNNEEIIGVTFYSGDFYPIIKNNQGQCFYNWKNNEKCSIEDIK